MSATFKCDHCLEVTGHSQVRVLVTGQDRGQSPRAKIRLPNQPNNGKPMVELNFLPGVDLCKACTMGLLVAYGAWIAERPALKIKSWDLP